MTLTFMALWARTLSHPARAGQRVKRTRAAPVTARMDTPRPHRAFSRAMRRTAPAFALSLALAGASLHAQPAPRAPSTDDGDAGVSPTVARQRLTRATVTVRDGSTERGRGVVLDGTGHIVTALAVAAGARDLRVVYPDGRVDRARLLASDEGWGVAVLDGGAARWPEGVPLASRDARSGDAALWVPAAGARPVAGTLAQRRTFVGPQGALLRDAWAITPAPPRSTAGAGVLQATTGALVAVVVPPAGDAEATMAEGLFAAPLPVLRALESQAATNVRPWLGVVTREIRMGEDAIVGSGGLRVTDVQPGSPAQRAGLRAGERGDVIVSVDGRRVVTVADLAAAMEGRRPGDTVVLQVVRANAQLDVSIALDVLPAVSPRR